MGKHAPGASDRQARENYDELYRRNYLRMYSKLPPLYQVIREITGYPARVD